MLKQSAGPRAGTTVCTLTARRKPARTGSHTPARRIPPAEPPTPAATATAPDDEPSPLAELERRMTAVFTQFLRAEGGPGEHREHVIRALRRSAARLLIDIARAPLVASVNRSIDAAARATNPRPARRGR
jgi:hypothetical protein